MSNEPIKPENCPGDECMRVLAERAKKERGESLTTHMANERTFLAWCRTSISLIVFGFVVERFNLLFSEIIISNPNLTKKMPDMHDFYYVSLFAFALAGIIILVSGYRYMYLRKMISKGEISMSIFPEVLVIISMVIIVAVVFILVLH